MSIYGSYFDPFSEGKYTISYEAAREAILSKTSSNDLPQQEEDIKISEKEKIDFINKNVIWDRRCFCCYGLLLKNEDENTCTCVNCGTINSLDAQYKEDVIIDNLELKKLKEYAKNELIKRREVVND